MKIEQGSTKESQIFYENLDNDYPKSKDSKDGSNGLSDSSHPDSIITLSRNFIIF